MGYTLLFKSLKGTDYRLIIDGGGTQITGAATPFETTEDANADMFTPVRTQNGYFRFIGYNDHANWLGMIPTDSLDKSVKLWTGNSIVWQGFITPQVYQNEYPGIGTQIHEIPVQCPLSVLDTVDVSTDINSHPVVTFGQLLQEYIFKTVSTAGTTISGYCIQGPAATTADYLNLKVMWANFVEIDSTGALKPKYTYKQLLEEFCKFFGYTCRMHGSVVYFTMPVDNSQGFTIYGASGLWNSQTGQASMTATISRGSFSITDNMFVDTNNNEEVCPGCGKVTVRSDINKIDNLMEIPYDELYDQYNVGLPGNPIIVRPLDWEAKEVYSLINYPDDDNTNLFYENDAVSITCHMEVKPDPSGENVEGRKYCRFLVYDDSDVGDYYDQNIPESKEQFGWRKCIELYHGKSIAVGSTPMFSITSKQVFVVCDGILYIDFKCQQVAEFFVNRAPVASGYPIEPHAICKLRIGDKYWNGSSWTTNSNATFNLEFTGSGARTTRTSITDPQYNGHGIAIDGTMRGIIEFIVVDVPAWVSNTTPLPFTLNGFMPMLDFEIGFVRGAIEDTKHNGNEYSNTGGNFRDEVNVDLIFASDVPYGTGNYVRRMPAGLGYILDNTNERPTQNIINMSGNYVIAEEELARLIAVYGNHTHRLVQLDLRTTLLGTVDPTMISATSEAGLSDIAGMFPLAISHNWRDDITTVTLIDL